MTEISYFFKTRVKGSVTPLIYGRDAKDLRGSEVLQYFNYQTVVSNEIKGVVIVSFREKSCGLVLLRVLKSKMNTSSY